MTMSTEAIVIGILVALVGVSGLIQWLLYLDMVDAINTKLPEDDQIPLMVVTWSELTKSFGRGVWYVPREFRRLFPDRRIYLWHTAAIIFMYVCGLTAVAVVILGAF
jgi:hypothetical protein